MSTLACMEGGGFEEDYKECVDGSGGRFNWTEVDKCAKVLGLLNSRDITIFVFSYHFTSEIC